MALVRDNRTTTTIVEEKPVAQRQVQTRNNIIRISTTAFNYIEKAYIDLSAQINANPLGLTVEQAWNCLSPDEQEELRKTGETLKSAVNALLPGTVPENEDVFIKPNADGVIKTEVTEEVAAEQARLKITDPVGIPNKVTGSF